MSKCHQLASRVFRFPSIHDRTGLLHLSRSSYASAKQFETHANNDSVTALIGLEIHAQLDAQTKLFTRIPCKSGAPPNSLIGLHDTAQPGSMPALNKRCLKLAVLLALGLNAQINMISHFDRKHYFYTDLPAGYQITQHSRPIAVNGYLDYYWSIPKPAVDGYTPPSTITVHDKLGQPYYRSRARIKRLQIEQDTGRIIHDPEYNRNLIDLNRSDVGLVEIVTEPDFVSSSQAVAFIVELVNLLKHLGCSKAVAAHGELRVDVNVSIGSSLTNQGSRVEVKNLNSIRAVGYSIDYEIRRQTAILQSGHQLLNNETRSYDPSKNITLAMRDKDLFQDYRFMPEPNLPSVRLLKNCSNCTGNKQNLSTSSTQTTDTVKSNRDNVLCAHCLLLYYKSRLEPTLPLHRKQKYLLNHALSFDRVLVLIDNSDLAHLYDNTLIELCSTDSGIDDHGSLVIQEKFTRITKELAYWITGQLYGESKRNTNNYCLPTPELMAEFIGMNLVGLIHGNTAEKLLNHLTQNGNCDASLHELASRHDWILIHDEELIIKECVQLLTDYPNLVKQYVTGGRKILKKLVHNLTHNPKYKANKFNPVIAEKLIKQLVTASFNKK